jgi:subfamily B ATP-binding cassette protein MsbA
MNSFAKQTDSDPRIVLQSAYKYWHYVALTVVLSFGAATFEGFSIGMLIPFLQTFADGTADSFQTGIQWVDNYILGVGDSELNRMYRICGAILLATWLRLGFGYYSSIFGIISRVRIVEDLRMRVVDRLQSVSLAFFTKARGGELINSITHEIGRTVSAIGVIMNAVQRGSLLLIYLTLMFWISWEMSLFVLVIFGVLSYALKRIVAAVRAHGQDITHWSGRFTSAISEFIDGVRTIIAYNRQSHERERLYTTANQFAEATIQSGKRSSLLKPLSQAVMSTVLVGLIVFAMQILVLPGRLDISYLLAFLFALFRMTPVIHQLNGMRGEWATNRAGIANVAALLRPDGKPMLENGSLRPGPLQEGIDLENVWFAYDTDAPVLKDINLHVERGKMTALVGASGAGKSTLVDLIPRFYDPMKGCISYDGVDLRDLDVHALRDRIAIVSQSTHVFNDSARANIAYGDLDATFEDVHEAARLANALEFIEDLEDGFDTILGDKGVRLSGGQRQRLSIARALLKNPEILILDEATSDLDSISEKTVQDSLERLMSGRTVIAIAHRLSTIENADWVAVLEEGQIVEQGPYEALLDQRGKLWEYHSIQYQMA